MVDIHSRVPVYEQIRQQVMEGARNGDLPAGAQLPSIRELARTLSVNVNTVKRAFDDLERDGVIVSVQGRGSFVAENSLGNAQLQDRYLRQVEAALRAARSGGVSRRQVTLLADAIFNDDKGEP